jgi:predicted GNAT family acetyltransferase
VENHLEVRKNEEAGRYEATVDGLTAELTYRMRGDRLVLPHTGVPVAIEGRGIGSALVKAAVEDAIRRDLTIVPVCPFVRAWLERHPGHGARVDGPGEG